MKGLILSDLHCGHIVGLSPPDYQLRGTSRIARLSRGAWASYLDLLREVGPVDFVIVNGDAIEGKGAKSGGVELVTSDREEQADMAVQCLRQIRGKPKYFMSYGTAYHVGSDGEDFENLVARDLNASIGGHDWLDVKGCVIDYRHHVGGSSVPHGRATAVLREWVWNRLWAERDEQPKADILIRSHVHTAIAVRTSHGLMMTTPALQCAGTIFGGRRCSGTVDWGMVLLDIKGKTCYGFHQLITTLNPGKAEAFKL